MPTPHPLIAVLVGKRREQGVPQWVLAEWLSVSLATFSNWEQGRHEPHLDRLVDWAGLLGLRLQVAPMFHGVFHGCATCANAAGATPDLPELETASIRRSPGTVRCTTPVEEADLV